MDPCTRPRGIVSRMRRMGSNVMRFRSGSRHHHHPACHGTSAANSLTTYHSQGRASNGRGTSSGAPSRNGVRSSSSSSSYANNANGLRSGGAGGAGGLSSNGSAATSAHKPRASAGSTATAVPTPGSASSAAGAPEVSNGDGGARKPASRAHSKGGFDAERDRKAQGVKDSEGSEEAVRRIMADSDPEAEGEASLDHKSSGIGCGASVGRSGGSGRTSRGSSGTGSGSGRSGSGGKGDLDDGPQVNPWREMKLHELLATLEDNSVSFVRRFTSTRGCFASYSNGRVLQGRLRSPVVSRRMKLLPSTT